MSMTDLFGPVIHRYTDEQALADGVLVSLAAVSSRPLHFRGRLVDRITSNLLNQLLPFLIDDRDPMAPAPAGRRLMSPGHKRALRSTIATKLELAQPTSSSGDRWHLPPSIILARNERGNWTLFLPEDD